MRPSTPAFLADSAQAFSVAGRTPSGRFVTLLIGGDSKNYRMDFRKLDFVFAEAKRVAENEGAQLLVTTSRRTNVRIEILAKKHFEQDPNCALLVIANEKNMDGVVYGMMARSDVVMVMVLLPQSMLFWSASRT